MSPTLDYRLKGAFSLLANDPNNPCLLNVLIFLILHKNSRGRCWISTDTIAQNATRGDPNKAVHAKQWLIEHDAIKLVPYEKRTGEELKLPKRQHIFQLTGFIRNDDIIYPYLYLSDTDLEEFRKAAEDIAGDIINQVHAKPKVKRIRNKSFIAHKSVSERTSNNNVTSLSSNSEVSDVHIMSVPNLSISNITRYIDTTYKNFQEPENSKTLPNPSLHSGSIDSNGQGRTNDSGSAASRDLINNLSNSAETYSEGGRLTSQLLQQSKISEKNIVSVYVDSDGEAVLDPSLTIINPTGHTTYICPSCRRFIVEKPNQICESCYNSGIQTDIKTLSSLNDLDVDGKYSKEIKQQIRGVQFAIMRSWPGMSQAYGWAGKVAQMLVGVSPKKNKEFYIHRLRVAATPDEVTEFAIWWKKHKVDNFRKPIDLPSSAEALEKFFSEFRTYMADEAKKKAEGARKYIEIDMSEYR